jgi:hypothetical protein
MQKTKMENAFTEIFNLPVAEEVYIEKQEYMPAQKKEADIEDDIHNDYRYARENLYGVIEKGTDALNTLVDLANQSQSPRAFEVVSTLIKTLSDTNKDLLEVQSKLKKLRKDEAPKNVTNALFIGNTAELQKLIKDRKEGL